VKQKVLQVFLYLALWLGALIGIPIRPDQVRDLLRAVNQPKVTQTMSDPPN
jgi:hypothetical protein